MLRQQTGVSILLQEREKNQEKNASRCKVLKLDKSIRQYKLATKYMKETPTKLPLNDC